MRPFVVSCLAALALLLTGAAAAQAGGPAKAPPDFFGVVPQAPLSGADLALMRGTVGTLRMPILWSECEPAPGEFDLGALDAKIGAAASAGIGVLPFVYGRPAWLGPQARPPLAGEALHRWKDFLRILVARYGPGGGFWDGRPARRPIRRWQIWNEPNFRVFWAPKVEPASYARLLHASAATIRRVDPTAKIVLAGIAPVGAGMKTWVFMRRLLRVPGVRRDFDIAALHPYSATIPELDYQLEKVRAAMAAGGAGRTPLIVTELGVASDGEFPSVFVKGERGQASFLRAAYTRLLQMRRRWHLIGAYWFTWEDGTSADPHCGFCLGAGLLRSGGTPKLAWYAFRSIVARAGRAVR